MKILSGDLRAALSAWFRSWRLITRNGLLHYFLYPVILSILLSMGVISLIHEGVGYAMAFIKAHIQYTPVQNKNTQEVVLNVLVNMATYATGFVIWLTALFSFLKISKYFVLALMSPLMALISERTEEILTGKKYPFHFGQFISDILRGVLMCFRNLFIELFIVWFLLATDLAVCLIFPPLAVLISPLIALFIFFAGAYFYGFSAMEYFNERKRMSIRRSVQSIRQHRGIAFGNGIIFSLLSSIPFIGITIGTVTCTVAATILMVEKEIQSGKTNSLSGA